MGVEITWSLNRQKSLEELVAFLEKKWEKKVIENLFVELNRCLKGISNFPEIYPRILKSKNIRKCVIKKRTLLLYRIKSKDNIELVIFADSRQNPKKYLIK